MPNQEKLSEFTAWFEKNIAGDEKGRGGERIECRARARSFSAIAAVDFENGRKESPMKKRTHPLSQVYRLLEPGPVVMVTTAHEGRANIMTMSWHTMMEFEPPLVGCVISNRNYTFDILRATKECVINIPTVELAEKVVGCGNTSGRRVDKFKAFGLTPATAACVKSPLIAECFANLECKVVDGKMVAEYNFFVLEVIKAWIDPLRKHPRTIHHQGEGVFMVAGRTIKLPSKMK